MWLGLGKSSWWWIGDDLGVSWSVCRDRSQMDLKIISPTSHVATTGGRGCQTILWFVRLHVTLQVHKAAALYPDTAMDTGIRHSAGIPVSRRWYLYSPAGNYVARKSADRSSRPLKQFCMESGSQPWSFFLLLLPCCTSKIQLASTTIVLSNC